MKTTKRMLLFCLAAALLLGIVTPSILAVSKGDAFAPGASLWGTQNNNGWYYLYRGTDGAYHELTFYDGSAAISWQRNAFASDPDAVGEMYFISQTSCFVGELGTLPVYAFRAPEKGSVTLTFETHGPNDLRVKVCQNATALQETSLNTAGPIGGYTKQTVNADVNAGDMLYILVSTTGSNREAWVRNYSVEYRSVGEFVSPGENPDPPLKPTAPTPAAPAEGVVYAPDFSYWGAQCNNYWYYMAKTPAGAYQEMQYRDGSAAIAWQKDAFASDPDADAEMYFINKNSCFVGELGTLPVYAFKCPAAGQVELTVLTHGQSDMTMQIDRGSEQVGKLTLNTTGSEGGFTKTVKTLNVNAGTMLYLVVSTAGASREAWIKDYSVKYLSLGAGPEEPTEPTEATEPTEPTEPSDADVYAPNMSAWGTQGNNGWYYLYQNAGGEFAQLDYYDAGAEIAWQRNAFAFDPNVMMEMLFINRTQCFLGENGSLPVYMFLCPTGGEVELTVLTHGQPDMQMAILKNSEKVRTVPLSTTGSEAGYTRTTVNLPVKKNTKLYLIVSNNGSGDTREAWVKDYSVKYLSRNDEEEPAEQKSVYSPRPEQWGAQGNDCWYYLYKGRDNVYNRLTYFTESEIEWQRNAFASVPDRDQEMFFINQSRFFTGELETRPVYGFRCPSGGEVELTVIAHGEPNLHLDILKNRELLDTITFSKDGALAGFTEYKYTIPVKKGTWLYLEGYTDDLTMREGFVNYYGVRYLSFNDEEEAPDDSLVGKVFTPDMNVLRQNNNGWYYMYYDVLMQAYRELARYGPYAAIEWQRNAFAFDPDMMMEMLFMTNDHYFVGENGSCPVYAFRCPSGGRVRLKVYTHGEQDMYMNVYHNGAFKDSFYYNTTGPYNRFTEHLLEMDVGKNDWIFLLCGSAGSHRDGWLSFYGVEYLTQNEQVGGGWLGGGYTPDLTSAWGKQDNNGWTFQYLDKADDLFRKMAFVRSKNEFEGTEEGGYEYLLIKKVEMHPAIKGDPAKVFTCEHGGKVQISFAAWLQAPELSKTGTGIMVYHNGEKIWPEDEDYYKVPGKLTVKRLTVDAAKGDEIAIVLDCIDENNSFDATNVRVCAKYLSSNDRERTDWPEYPEEMLPERPAEPDGIAIPTETAEEPSTAPETSREGNGEEPQPEKPFPLALTIAGGAIVLAGAAAAGFWLLKKRRKK